jgi:hypothetical protein
MPADGQDQLVLVESCGWLRSGRLEKRH